MLRRYALVLAVVLAPAPAFAYVDPGSGMLVWQGLIALVGAVLMFVREPRAAFKRLLDWFKRR